VGLETKSSPVTRRRGQALENALLDAAWDELVAVGYGLFTIDAVAARAEASRHVIYRRWSSREQLVQAAIQHHLVRDPPVVPDTGNLRDDLIASLSAVNETRSSTVAVITALFGTFYQETGTTLAEMRAQLAAGRPRAMEIIIARAVERGEIDPTRLTPLIMTLPMDLFRNQLMMTLQSVPRETIVAIVDEAFLPLVRPASS
jgi:AcrR family transcriptional regulator